jgi:hypothetical protein
MIQVVGRNADGSLGVILGLTAENIQRLVNAQPIVVALPELGLGEGTLIITYGATHDDITASLRFAGLPVNDMGSPEPGHTFRQHP